MLEGFIIAASCSLDALAASFAYGNNKIKIPFLSVIVITVVCSCVLGLSLFFGEFLREFLPTSLTTIASFWVLFIIGTLKLFDSITKSIIRKYNKSGDSLLRIKFSAFNFRFILNLYADPEKADLDASKTISCFEAAGLALALSLDGAAIGFGAALGQVSVTAVFMSSLVLHLIMLPLGCHIGNKTAGKLNFNLSWLSGLILMLMAAIKLL
ncbi:MAG: sporulation membrane protein YtaF [Oscillospiraceae bacterium]|nr:sporulation membrane protein YtaF [Oscillospiraceae bacterium]